MPRPLLFILPLLFFSAALWALLSGQLSQNEKLAAGPAFKVIELPSEPSSAFPQVGVVDPAGKVFKIQEIWGKARQPRLILFWASWCYPCLTELEAVEKARPEMESLGLSILPIGIAMSSEQWKLGQKLWEEKQFDWPLYWDQEDRYAEELNIEGLPSAWLLDAQGRMRTSFRGSLPESPQKLESLMKQQLQKLSKD